MSQTCLMPYGGCSDTSIGVVLLIGLTLVMYLWTGIRLYSTWDQFRPIAKVLYLSLLILLPPVGPILVLLLLYADFGVRTHVVPYVHSNTASPISSRVD
jgi:hypothetical protein